MTERYPLIHILRMKATSKQIAEMLEELNPLIKVAVDIRRNILAGGGQMHADCESMLLADGSNQIDIWGANWIPITQTVEFEALINIRPNQKNYSMIVQDPDVSKQIEDIIIQLLGGV